MSDHQHFPAQLATWDHTSEHPATHLPSSPADDADHDDDYPVANEADTLAPPDFRPFFILVEDPQTGHHHHPTVQYVFSDDDPDLITSSIIDASNTDDKMEHRTLLMDVAEDGRSVTSAHSLSSTWQISRITTSKAPSWDEAGREASTETTMLQIEGSEAPVSETIRPKSVNQSQQEDALPRAETVIHSFTDQIAQLEVLIDNDTLTTHTMPQIPP